MAWDLGRAMFKKQEFECARLMDFEFRLRARTMKLLAVQLGLPAPRLIARIADGPDEAILESLAAEIGRPREEIEAAFHRLGSQARKQLIEDVGDPTPYRLG